MENDPNTVFSPMFQGVPKTYPMLKRLIDQSPSPSGYLNQQSQFAYINLDLARLLGTTMIGRRFEDMSIPKVYPLYAVWSFPKRRTLIVAVSISRFVCEGDWIQFITLNPVDV
jgi:hypothetical protein